MNRTATLRTLMTALAIAIGFFAAPERSSAQPGVSPSSGTLVVVTPPPGAGSPAGGAAAGPRGGRRGGGAQPSPTPTPNPEDLTTTTTLQLKNQNIEQLVKFLTETTGKPVIYDQQDVGNTQVTVVSPKPVTRGKALELIYDSLLLKGIYVVEMDDQIRIVKADAIKNMQFQSVPDTTDLQTMPDSTKMMQKVYHLHNITPDSLKEHLSKFVPDSSMTFDPATNTLILIDQVSRLKGYDRIVRALDQADEGDRSIEFFPLKNTEAPEMADLVLSILAQSEDNASSNQNGGARSGRPGGSRGGGSGSSVYRTGEISIVPDARVNVLIVACPRDKLAQIKTLIEQLDQPKPQDVMTRMIEVKYVNTSRLAQSLSQLFPRTDRMSVKEQVQIVPYLDGDRLIVRSSQENFAIIQKMVAQIDTPEADQQETRTYTIEHLKVADLAPQLNNLFEQTNNTSYSSGDYSYSYRQSSRQQGQPVFVPIPRSNTLVVMAKGKDFKFIEDMIHQLDKQVNMDTFEPKIFQIRNTDANELVKVLETLFTGRSGSSSAADLYNWRGSSSSDNSDSIKDLFGDMRFVVDTITNRVVVLTSHPENYPVVAKMIEQIDKFDPDASTVLTYELKYADAFDVADHLNNLFSEGAVNRPNQPQPNPGGNNNNNNNNNNNGDNGDNNAFLADTPQRTMVYPWQSGGQQNRPGQTAERPINTMVGNVRVVPDERSSKLIIAAPAIYFETLRNLIEQLDRPAPQVNIHTQVLEITRGEERRIGIRWTPDPSTIQPAELDNAFVGLGQLGFLQAAGNRDTGPSNVTTSSPFGGITRSLSATTGAGSTILSSNINLALLIQLLEKNSNTQVLSDPNITVNNNQKGIVFVGNKFPFRSGTFTQNTGAQNDTINYQKIGVNMGIKPQINVEGKIVMTISLENSSIADERVGGDLVTNLTQLNTQVAVDGGETLVIGGILIKSELQNNRQVPVLGSIPVLGWLFRKHDGTDTTRELMVFITPDVLRSRQDADALYKKAKSRMDEIENKTSDTQSEAQPPAAM